MDPKQLQMHLAMTRRYHLTIDGDWGRGTDAAVMQMFQDGPDTLLVEQDFIDSAARLKVQPAAIRAFWSVEAAGVGFLAGMPKILPERHRFSKLTGGRFDKSHPTLSSPTWNRSWYPATQGARYEVVCDWGQLLSKAGLPVDAAFAATSWGGPQILGENAARCWITDPVLFAEHMSRDERSQLLCFEAFVQNAGILPSLRLVNRTLATWQTPARLYNGTAFKVNQYDQKMLAAFIRFGGQ